MSRTNRVHDGDYDRLRQIALNHAVDVTLPTAAFDAAATAALVTRASVIEDYLRTGGERVETTASELVVQFP